MNNYINKEKIRSFLKIRDNQFLILLMLFAIFIRLYYFIKLGNQPIWWDEGDYLSIAKVWALNMPKPEWWHIFAGMRPLLIPLIWAFIIKIGIGEFGMRFITLLIPSILTIYLVYAVGRDLYNNKIGLIAGFIMSVYWVHLFYTYRLLTDIPAMFFGMLTIYFFYSRYIKKGEAKGLYLSILFGVLSFSARFPYAFILITCFLFLLIIEKKEFFKNKTNWKALALIFLLLSPYLIYLIYTKFYLLSFYFGERAQATNLQIPFSQALNNIFGLFPSLFGPGLSILKNVFLIFLIIGAFGLYRFFICFDIFWKQQDKKFNAEFFLILWILVQLFFYVIIMKVTTDRWLLMLMPALFTLASRGFISTYIYLKKYSKILAIFLVIFLILFGGYYQLKHTNNLINIKKDSYKEVMLGGLWLKENTPKDAKVITASIVQNEYYSERDTYSFSVYFKNNNSEASNKALFEQKVEKIKPDYLILNIVQRTPDWAYTYPQEKGLTPVKYYLATKEESIMYGVPEGQPLLIIYKF